MGRAGSVVLGILLFVSLPVLELAAPAHAAQSSFLDEIANLRSPNVGTRVKAAKTLGKSGRPEAIPALTEAVRDPELKVRRAAVEALRRFTSTEAIDGLLIGLKDEDNVVRREALKALLEIYVGAGNAEMPSALGWLRPGRKKTPILKGLVPVEERVTAAVAARLQDEEPSLRRRAAYTLGVLGSESAVRPLTASLADGDKNVRRTAVSALADIGTDEAGKALTKALAAGDKEIAGAVVDALGEIRYRPAAPALVNVYDKNVNKLGERALAALARMGAPEARGIFYYQMTSKDPDHRRWAVEGLGRLGDTSLVPGLIKDFLREPDPKVQLAYCFALARLGSHEFVDRIALDLANKKLKEQAHVYAVELGSDLLNELVTYLSDPVPAVRMEMAQVLMEIGDPAAIPYLEPLLGDPNREVADRANRAIARLKQGRMSASAAIP